MAEHYQRPDWFTAHVFNPAVATLTRLGLSVAGSRVLEVRGRKTGQPRRTPVNLLIVDGNRYLVAPRGQTQWVRNLRAQGEGRLLVGRRTERFSATEIADADKPALLRAYLKRWNWEVGTFFDGVGPESPDDELRHIAPDHPVFRISEPAARRRRNPPLATSATRACRACIAARCGHRRAGPQHHDARNARLVDRDHGRRGVLP